MLIFGCRYDITVDSEFRRNSTSPSAFPLFGDSAINLVTVFANLLIDKVGELKFSNKATGKRDALRYDSTVA